MIRWFLLAAQLATPGMPAAPDCETCHPREAQMAAGSAMAHSLTPAGESGFLKDNPTLAFHSGDFSYSIRREGNQSVYSVTDGNSSIAATLEWAFGAGLVGQTFLYRKDGAYYEATVSYYPEIHGLDLTPGHRERSRRNLGEASGRRVGQDEIRRCFGCHSTDVAWNQSSAPASLTPGVQCEECHAGSARHAIAVTRGEPGARLPRLAAMKTEELADLCNKCHPSWADIAAKRPSGDPGVRFQFYRLADSRCYDSADTRIACTACHDPHGKLTSDASFYDSRCQRCHATEDARAKLCPVSKQDCIGCHMPKVEVSGLHYRFTDHQIRVVREGER